MSERAHARTHTHTFSRLLFVYFFSGNIQLLEIEKEMLGLYLQPPIVTLRSQEIVGNISLICGVIPLQSK